MAFKAWLNKIWPCYAYLPSLIVFAVNMLVYTGSKLINANLPHYDLTTKVDGLVPFLPWFVAFYVLAFAQWAWNYFYHARIGREQFYHIVTADIIAKLFCLVLFIAMPTAIVRPQVLGTTFWDNFVRFIYFVDTPTNLFPSVHCLASWICFRACVLMKKAPWWYKWLQLLITLLVFASTVVIKQHFVVDILAGVAVAEIGWFLSKRFSLWRYVAILETPAVRLKYGKLKGRV